MLVVSEVADRHDHRCSRLRFGVLAALAREAALVRPREGLDGLRLSHLVLLDVAEARHLEAGDERRAVGLVTLDETNWAMASRADGFRR